MTAPVIHRGWAVAIRATGEIVAVYNTKAEAKSHASQVQKFAELHRHYLAGRAPRGALTVRPALWIVAALLSLAACSPSFELPEEPQLYCRPGDGSPNCNGDARADECAAAGLPDAYGVDAECRHPVRPVGNECVRRPQGVYRCVRAGDLLCCYP